MRVVALNKPPQVTAAIPPLREAPALEGRLHLSLEFSIERRCNPDAARPLSSVKSRTWLGQWQSTDGVIWLPEKLSRGLITCQGKEDTNVKQYALAVAMLTACAIGLLLHHQPARVIGAPEAAKQKWEYKKGAWLDEAEMNKLGDQGWELVAVTPDKDWSIRHYVFKRAK